MLGLPPFLELPATAKPQYFCPNSAFELLRVGWASVELPLSLNFSVQIERLNFCRLGLPLWNFRS